MRTLTRWPDGVVGVSVHPAAASTEATLTSPGSTRFGDAPFKGSMGSTPLNRPVVGMAGDGDRYLMVAADGGIVDFSDRPFAGSLGANPPAHPIVFAATLDT